MANISIERSFEIGTHYRPELIYKADPYLEIGIVKLASFLDGETFYRAYVNEDTENPIEGLTIEEALDGVMMENNLTMDDLHLVYKREDSNV